MPLGEEELQRLVQEATSRAARARASGDAACPSREELIEAGAAPPGAAARRHLANHVAECSDCARNYRLLAELGSWATQAGGGPIEVRRSGRRGGAPVLALAAGLAIAVGLGFWVWSRPDPQPSSSQRGVSEAGLRALDPPPGATLAAPPRRLSWQAPRSLAEYTVILYDAEGTVLWSSPELRASAVELPVDAQTRLQEGRKYFWQVVVEDAAGRKESGLFPFQLAER